MVHRTSSCLTVAALGTALFGLGPAAVTAAHAAPSPPTAGPVGAAGPQSPSGGPFAAAPLCDAPAEGHLSCFAVRAPTVPASGVRATADRARSSREGDSGGLSPSDIQDAYRLPPSGGDGRTVAIIDAFDSPNAEADLAEYRAHFGLPPCTSGDGCFTKVDQRGGDNYPPPHAGWAGETALDMDMVSATAPDARILLVEADDDSAESLGVAVDRAVAMGAQYVSNSYGTRYDLFPESVDELDWNKHYDHPGVAIVASSGDDAYGIAFPADSPQVTSVGGTSLVKDPATARGWSESAWTADGTGPGSGCALFFTKPAFQQDTGCPTRTVADVSAVADPATGVAVYDSFGSGGWTVLGGTSVSSPIIAGVYADAGKPVEHSYPNTYPYRSGSGLNDIVTGRNAASCPSAYLCVSGPGYDGPTGLGTPDGTGAFRMAAHATVTGVVQDERHEAIAGAAVTAEASTATTDAEGRYTLVVPPGTHTLRVDAYGYTVAGSSDVKVGADSTVRRTFALRKAELTTVTGKITDGSGHGWPLHASIRVTGAPGDPVWNDPFTGGYRLRLPAGHTYVLHITTDQPGYSVRTQTLTVGKKPLVDNAQIAVDDRSASAAGYAVHLHGPTEPFDSSSAAPDGWQVAQASGTTGTWAFDDPGSRGNNTGGAGAFAVVDSDFYGSGTHQDTTLTSPPYDLKDAGTPILSFDTEYHAYSDQAASVEVSTDGGSTWQEIRHVEADVPGPYHAEIPLTDFKGASALRVRFRFVGSWGYWWAVDDVFVGDRTYDPVAGTLAAGLATDANTGTPLNGVQVTDTTTGLRTTTAPAGEDPALSSGFYRMFLPSGPHRLNAAKDHYTSLTVTPPGRPDAVSRADLPLKAGRLTVDPGPISATTTTNGQTAKRIVVRNTGTSPAVVSLTDRAPVAGEPDAPGAPADSWAAAPTLPVSLMDNAVDSYHGAVYSFFGLGPDTYSSSAWVLAPGSKGWEERAHAGDPRHAVTHGFIGDRFYAAGGWLEDGSADPALEVYDPATDTWTTGAPQPQPRAASGSAVSGGLLYAIGGCTGSCSGLTIQDTVDVYDPVADSWTEAAPYPQAADFLQCAGIGGKVYCAGGADASGDPLGDTYVYTPAADTWQPVAALPQAVWGASSTVANGRLLVLGGRTAASNRPTGKNYAYDPVLDRWSALPDSPAPVYRGGAATGVVQTGGSTGTGSSNATSSAWSLTGWSQSDAPDLPWLDHQQQLRLGPGRSVELTLTVRGSATPGPGSYTGTVVLRDDTPYGGAAVTVRLRVVRP